MQVLSCSPRSLIRTPASTPMIRTSRSAPASSALLVFSREGFEGGGPHLDLLRRLAHWLMKEPDLEEEALRANVRGHVIEVERQSLKADVPPVTVASPSGAE
jgi:hypothetical protein